MLIFGQRHRHPLGPRKSCLWATSRPRRQHLRRQVRLHWNRCRRIRVPIRDKRIGPGWSGRFFLPRKKTHESSSGQPPQRMSYKPSAGARWIDPNEPLTARNERCGRDSLRSIIPCITLSVVDEGNSGRAECGWLASLVGSFKATAPNEIVCHINRSEAKVDRPNYSRRPHHLRQEATKEK